MEAFRIYGLQIIIGLIALLGIWKDYTENEKRSKKHGKWIYLGLFSLTVFLMILSIVDTHSNRVKVAKDAQQAFGEKQTADARIKFLTDQIGQLRDDSKANSDGFRKSFDGLYQRFADLQAKVTNVDLIREIDDTKKELRATQEKLNTPKVTLVPSFYFLDYSYKPPIVEMTASRQLDGSIPIDFVVINPSDVSALRGEIILRICDFCQYAKEPEGFAKRNGAHNNDRAKSFDHILGNTALEKMTADIIPPPNVSHIEILVIVVCENCGAVEQRLGINLK
ncbi:MAG: hypothetical protein WCD43_07615 [Candidatus Acidiferrales bacterium]